MPLENKLKLQSFVVIEMFLISSSVNHFADFLDKTDRVGFLNEVQLMSRFRKSLDLQISSLVSSFKVAEHSFAGGQR